MPGWFHPGLTEGSVVRAGGLEPPRPVRVCGFSYHFGFRRLASNAFVVWTISSPSLLTEHNDALALLFAAMGLATSNAGIALRMSSMDEVRLRCLLEHIVREEWDWALPHRCRSRPLLRQP